MSNFWNRQRAKIRKHLAEDPISNFPTWEPIYSTMVTGSADYIETELNYIKAHSHWDILHELLSEPPCMARDYYPDTHLTGNTIHHLYSLLRFGWETKAPLQKLEKIVEFGSGFASAYRVLRQLGYLGKYYVYDYPELCEIQQYYVHDAGLTKDFENSSIFYDIPRKFDLLIGTWSLTEAPFETQKQFFDLEYKYILLAYSLKFDGIDNIASINWLKENKDFESAIDEPILHLPGNRYFFGVTK